MSYFNISDNEMRGIGCVLVVMVLFAIVGAVAAGVWLYRNVSITVG